MISTIAGKLSENISLSEIFYATFPMGSMTGAPKKRVLELIEKYEKTKRGLFSGSVGYITPNGDFDFNVVIRSILYNEKNRYLSIPAGSAITWKSDAEKEFEECVLKIEGMKKALEWKELFFTKIEICFISLFTVNNLNYFLASLRLWNLILHFATI